MSQNATWDTITKYAESYARKLREEEKMGDERQQYIESNEAEMQGIRDGIHKLTEWQERSYQVLNSTEHDEYTVACAALMVDYTHEMIAMRNKDLSECTERKVFLLSGGDLDRLRPNYPHPRSDPDKTLAPEDFRW